MNNEIFLIWQEIQADLSTSVVLWQLAIIMAAVAIAHGINGMLRKYVMEHAPLHWKIAIGSINRVLFPLTSLILILVGQLILEHWQHIGLLKLANRLFLAMAAIRLIVYFMRYIFTGAWLKTLENVAAWTIWGLLALHLTGLLPQIMDSLASVQFSIGKNPVNLLLIIQGLFTIVITIFIALWISRLFENKLMRAEQVNMNMRVVLTKLIRIVLLFVAILIALSAVGLDITLLSVFGGALGVGLGFGLQKIASNYVSGFIILLDKSMQIGDVIAVDKHYGVVHDLRSRYMVLNKLDGTNVIIPNETLITTAVVNHSLMEHKGRVQINFTISYDSPIELAVQLTREIALKHSRVLEMPAPVAFIRGFGEQGAELVLTVWIADPEKGASSLQSALYLDVWKASKLHAIRFVKPADIKVE
ncbi:MULTISPECIES: mechanosensitive ion channel family protein [Methylotenera]|uniref:mechanosensitive ion channel family protein n=1 Tax=Methylotenera TaxID=359407 RepID=UPI000371AAE0|nr:MULTISPECIES: mechanosensitive ion channel domain-containing protein [Methylotenera]